MSRGSAEWLRPSDVLGGVPGRDDPGELKLRCLRHLRRQLGSPKGSSARESAFRVKAQVATERIRASASAAASAAPSLVEQLEDAKATIDVLLAYVPKHHKELEASHVQDVLRRVASAGFATFGNWPSIVTAATETSRDSFACHRITLVIQVRDTDDPVMLAEREIAFHREANSLLNEEERLSVQLHVEFQSADRAESD